MRLTDGTLGQQYDAFQRKALLVGAAALAVCVIGALFSAERFFQTYLVGFVFWTNLSLGCLGLLMLHHLVGGGWGFAIQRVLEAGTRVLPLMALLFVPLIFGIGSLYEWAKPEHVAHDAILQQKAWYLDREYFVLRSLIYFAVWLGLMFLLNRWSRQLDRAGNERKIFHLEHLSGPGIVALVLSVTFAATDWVMSLEPHWFSTIYGLLFVVGQGLAALAFSVLVLQRIAAERPLSEIVGVQQFHDLGNLVLAFVMLWAYMSLSQFLIIWMGNLPEEVPWYLRRTVSGWHFVAALLILLHFVLPFLLLLSQRTKRSLHVLAPVALGIFVMRVVEMLWLVLPAFPESGFLGFVWSVVAVVGVGGLWLGVFVWQVKTRPLLALHDPRLEEAFEHHG